MEKFFSFPVFQITVTSIFVLIYIFMLLKVKATEIQKRKNIKKRQIHDAVETDSPSKDQIQDLKNMGLIGLEDRFTFIKKALPIVLFLIWASVMLIPYLGKIPTVYVSVIAAIISVIAGLSLRPFLENLFSGIVISFFKSIKVGDTVIIDGHYGLIEEIGLTYSVLKRWDWYRVVIPNTKLLQIEIQNLTMNDEYIWAYVEFFVSPKSNIAEIEAIAMKAVADSETFESDTPPSFWVMEMNKDSVKCWIAAWANNPSSAWELRNEIRKNLMTSFNEKNIDCHIHNLTPLGQF